MPIVGDVLAERYRIDGILGAGGMASVYRATDLRLERQVAVKVLLPNLARDASIAGRFDREARMLAAVAHPSVAAIFDVEPGDRETGREPFYVMELCDGGSLADRIAAAGALPPEELVPILGTVADGLAELHRNGIVHRDVKPGNILFAGLGPTAGGRPKLADFGLAKPGGTAEASTLTAPGTMAGTLPYLAPELLAGGPPTTASDVYALGATAFQGLTGRLPKPFDSIGRFVDARWTPAPTVSSAMPGLGTAFDGPVAAALAIDPAARPTAPDFADSVRAALGDYGGDAGEPGGDAARAASIGLASISPPTLVLAPPAALAAPEPVASKPVTARRGAARAAPKVRATTVGTRALEVLAGLALIGVVALVALGGTPSPIAGSAAGPTPGATTGLSPFETAPPLDTASPTPTPEPRGGNGHGHHRGDG